MIRYRKYNKVGMFPISLLKKSGDLISPEIIQAVIYVKSMLKLVFGSEYYIAVKVSLNFRLWPMQA
jgi:hypothetical protein